MSSRPRKFLITFLLLGVGIVLLGTGILIHPPDKSSEFIALFLEHLGIGLFAVTVLKIFIEEAAQKQFLTLLRTDVKEQVSTTVISFIRRGSWILNDQVLKKELEDSVLLPHFTRPEYNVTLRLEPLENHPDLLKVWITLEYHVKNVSDIPRAYPLSAWLDDVIKLDDLAAESKPGFRSVSINAVDYPIQNQSGAKRVSCEELMIQLTGISTPIINPEDRIPVRVVGMQIMRIADHFVWNLPTITHKLGLSIELGGGLTFDQLEVCPREMHHISHQEFIGTLDDSEPNTWRLSINHVLLPFQGVELRWAPRVRKPAPEPVPQPATA